MRKENIKVIRFIQIPMKGNQKDVLSKWRILLYMLAVEMGEYRTL